MLWKLRCWLIQRLAGSASVMIGWRIEGGIVAMDGQPALIVRNHLYGCSLDPRILDNVRD